MARSVTALSFLLLLATAGAVVRSFLVTDMVEHFTAGPHNGLTLGRSRVRAVTGRGMVYLMHMEERNVCTDALELKNERPDFVFEPFWRHNTFPADWPNPVADAWLGCGYEVYAVLNPTGWSTPRTIAVRFPLWALLPVFAAPLLVGPLIRRRGARRPGCCRRCGYDLRASPSGCPECGDGRPAASPDGHDPTGPSVS